MTHSINTYTLENFDESCVDMLLDKEEDAAILKNFLSEKIRNSLKSETLEFLNSTQKEFTLNLSDGLFAPLPYSSVREDMGNDIEKESSYFKSAIEFKKRIGNNNVLKEFQLRIENLFNINEGSIQEGLNLLPFAARLLYNNKNGIDIHCENAFLNQLNLKFKNDLNKLLDLENAISLFVVLKQPQNSGELVLFDHEWKDVQFNVNQTSYKERHDLNGSIFTNRNYPNPNKTKIKLNEGDAIIFRAAQIWHSVSNIDEDCERMTIGFFIGKGHDGMKYYWA